ncbi:MAG: helix-hairpin-helix domain-containing protein [Candidatus Thorarchaeota archaeon]
MENTLEYRNFPGKTAVYYLLFSPFIAYCIFIISKLLKGDYFTNPGIDHLLLLGLGMGMAALLIIPIGVILDRTHRGKFVLSVSALIPMIMSVSFKALDYPPQDSPTLETAFILAIFSGLVSVLVSWGISLNQTVVAKFRGRIVASFLSASILISMMFMLFETLMASIDFPLMEFLVIGSIFASFTLKPWKWSLHPLAVQANALRYFVPMFFLLASHIIWYFSTKMAIRSLYDLVGEAFIPLVEDAAIDLGGIPSFGILQLLFVVAGIIIAGMIADFRGRKTAFSTAVLAFGLLAIFGQTFYYIASPGTSSASVQVLALPLLGWERFVEGYILGLCLLLIWSELGSPNRKGLRLSLVIWFYIGYMALFWAADLGVPFGNPPDWVGDIGGPFAIFFSLLALWQNAHLPEILGREIEMEDFALDFDQKMVDKTVSAYLEDEDFESIKTQMAVIDASQEMSDKEFNEFLGEDLKKMLPLKRVKGIGPALEQKLKKAGYDSAAQLAGETPRRLASKIKGMSEKQAERILLNAREAVNRIAKR